MDNIDKIFDKMLSKWEKVCAEMLSKADSKKPLLIQGKATDNIWLMLDGEEPHAIGLRLDCGDGGVVYLTRKQALHLSSMLKRFV